MSKKNSKDKVPTRQDVQNKIAEIDASIKEAKSSSQDVIKIVIGVAVVAAVLLAFASGQRRASLPKTIVSFTKLK